MKKLLQRAVEIAEERKSDTIAFRIRGTSEKHEIGLEKKDIEFFDDGFLVRDKDCIFRNGSAIANGFILNQFFSYTDLSQITVSFTVDNRERQERERSANAERNTQKELQDHYDQEQARDPSAEIPARFRKQAD